jgi:hypothetical protein
MPYDPYRGFLTILRYPSHPVVTPPLSAHRQAPQAFAAATSHSRLGGVEKRDVLENVGIDNRCSNPFTFPKTLGVLE